MLSPSQSIYNFLPATYLEGTPIEYHMLPAKLAGAGYVSVRGGRGLLRGNPPQHHMTGQPNP